LYRIKIKEIPNAGCKRGGKAEPSVGGKDEPGK
jgi:hypothetical protein